MRTTLTIKDDIYNAVKKRAAAEGKTLSSVVEEALDKYLESAEPEKPFKLRWVTYRGKLMEGVDISDRKSLYDIMEGIM
jgi:hypothetical protein